MITAPARRAFVVLLLVAGAACKRTPAGGGTETLEIRHLGTPNWVQPEELAEDLGYLAPVRLVHVGDTSSGPQSIQAVVTGDTDVGSAFNGAVLKLVAAKVPIVAVVGSYGTDDQFHSALFVQEGSPIKAARDLVGKKVAMNTLGAHYEFFTKELLFGAGLKPPEVDQVTMIVLPPVNTEQALRQGQVDAAVLGTIYRERAIERGGLRAIATDLALFGPFSAGSYVMRRAFVAENPTTARRFVEATAKAIAWSQSQPRAVVLARLAAIIGRRGRNENAALVPYWRSYGLATRGGALRDRDFQLWIDWMVRAGELAPGQLKPADVYTNALHPLVEASAQATP